MSDMPDQAAAARAGETTEDDEIGLLDLLIVLVKHRRLVVGTPVLAALAAATISFLWPNTYTGSTKILPPQQSASTAAALLNQLGGALGGIAGGVGANVLGGRNPNDLYVGMLRSRTVADNLISRFDLGKVYDEDRAPDIRKRLEKDTAIASGRDGIITIDVDDKNAKRAADLANAYVEELVKLTKVLAVTEASKRRLFFERQLELAKDGLASAEAVARQGLQKGGIAQVDAQGRSMIAVTARLRAEISAKEVQLGAMRTFAAEGNPELQRTQNELEALRRELGRVEGSSSISSAGRGDVPGNSGLQNLSRLRDVRYYEFLYELLAKQYELAKIDEAKDAVLIQVLDKAIVPEMRSKPQVKVVTSVYAILGLLLGIAAALMLEYLEASKKDPHRAKRLAQLTQYLRHRKS